MYYAVLTNSDPGEVAAFKQGLGVGHVFGHDTNADYKVVTLPDASEVVVIYGDYTDVNNIILSRTGDWSTSTSTEVDAGQFSYNPLIDYCMGFINGSPGN